MDLNIGSIIQISEINYIITSFNEHIAFGKKFEEKNSHVTGLYTLRLLDSHLKTGIIKIINTNQNYELWI